jgi:hypothetical protein
MSAMIARSRFLAIFCRRLIEGMAAVTYMQRGMKSKCRSGPEVMDGVEQQ